jgi:putative PIN family toxin of toxin-antitoxin system
VIRVVLDTNVFVSSFFGGNPRKVVDLWKAGDIIVCLSKAIIDEYVAVLRRLGLENQRELEELLTLLARGFHVLFSARTPTLRVVAGDPADDKFIECAVAVKADFVISGDKALTEIGDYMGIPVVTPRAFLERFRASRG